MTGKWLKKMAVGLLAATLLLSSAPSALAGDDAEPAIAPYALLHGKIQSLGESSLLFAADEASALAGDFYLHLSQDTVIAHAVTGEVLTFDALTEGMELYIYISPAVALSLPPQGNALFVLTGAPEGYEPPAYEALEAQYHPAPLPKTLRIWGSAAPEDSGRILITNTVPGAAYAEVSMLINAHTLILNAVSGMPVPVESIQAGDAVYAWVSPAMTRSLPPQTNAMLIICSIPADFGAPQYYEIARLTPSQEGKGLTVSTDDGAELALTEATGLEPFMTDQIITLDSITAQSGLLVWRGMDGQISRVMVFPQALSTLGAAQPEPVPQEPTEEPAEEPAPEEPVEEPAPQTPVDPVPAPETPEEAAPQSALIQGSADGLLTQINQARAKAGKSPLTLEEQLSQAALLYAEKMLAAGPEFYTTTDFTALPDGSSVYSLLSATGYKKPITGFGYSVWRSTTATGEAGLKAHIDYVQSTNLYNQRAVNGEYAKIGIATVTASNAGTPYTMVIMIYHK